MLRPAIFLDRDGTLNVEKHYLYKREDWEWTHGAIAALQQFHAASYALVVVTNQSGIARGYYSAADVEALHGWVAAELLRHGLPIDGFYYCPHEPTLTGECECRKPKPGMLLAAAHDHGIDLAQSWMIGDKQSDIEAGFAAGTRSILLTREPQTSNFLHCPTLAIACDYILDTSER